MNQKGIAPIFIIILALVIIGGSSYYLINKDKKQKNNNQSSESELGPKIFPDFIDFFISEKFEGQPVSPDFSQNSEALTYFTAISEDVKNGPNFAGHYTVATWGCGTMCQSMAIVDAKNGKIYFPLFTFEAGIEFRKDSSLIIINPVENVKNLFGNDVPEWLITRYYNWENGELVEIYSSAGQIQTSFKDNEYVNQKEELKTDGDEINSLLNLSKVDNWKTYLDKEHGFELKYPAEWFIKERYLVQLSELEESNILLKELMIDDEEGGGDNRIIDIRIYNNYSSLNLLEWLESKKNDSSERGCGVLDYQFSSELKIISIDDINGLRGYVSCCCGGFHDSFFVQKENKVYSIGMSGPLLFEGEKEKREYYEKLFNDIVSNFKFLD